MSDEWGMRNAESARWWASFGGMLKSTAADAGRGKSGFPINGGAARPVHFSRSAAQRESGFGAVGV